MKLIGSVVHKSQMEPGRNEALTQGKGLLVHLNSSFLELEIMFLGILGRFTFIGKTLTMPELRVIGSYRDSFVVISMS